MRRHASKQAAAFWIVREEADFNLQKSLDLEHTETPEPSLLPFHRSHFDSKLLLHSNTGEGTHIYVYETLRR